MSWMLRRAAAADLDAIMAIERSVFTSDAWSADSMARELVDEHGHYLVATPADEPDVVVAYAGLLAPRGSGQGDIQTIAVAPDARSGGLGRALMQALLAEAWRRGAHDVFLEVRADNPVAQALYRSLGFAELGRRRGYYQPDGVDALVMRARLTAPVTRPAASVVSEVAE
ncbi:ribosomal protein S18-alanine N-acetyltransferase [Agromyces mangrovi Wang et al. 2018]|uniref:ribosomal protein S18-alanine N-acetyltransferase n=1 Tax=Agromyces mangrovi TaxID=1858653 RepID=UPI0025727D15|nr:ribosomal protein S18-alanine N-acetyltransferase [Agromyces mangrovi]BDZ63840.1 ribosomal-protein-alanine acetyltransferase [Agromyces mangrovi]